MLYDTKEQQSLKLTFCCTYDDNDMNACLHPLSRFISPHANIDFSSSQSSL